MQPLMKVGATSIIIFVVRTASLLAVAPWKISYSTRLLLRSDSVNAVSPCD